MSELYTSMTPVETLEDGEFVQESFGTDRATYWRDHALMAALAMAVGMGILWVIGNPHVWTGAVGGLLAIAVRGGYLASDELKARWDLTNRRLMGPLGKIARLRDISELRVLGSAVQVVTRQGDKHLLKYQKDRDATRARIEAALGQVT